MMKKSFLGLMVFVTCGFGDVSSNLHSGFVSWKFAKDVKLCTASTASKCYSLGEKYSKGEGTPKDTFKAYILYQFAQQKHLPRTLEDKFHQHQEALKSYTQSEIYNNNLSLCKAAPKEVCHQVARMYMIGGLGVKKDLKKAKILSEISCNAGDVTGCHSLAVAYQKGRGVRRDLSKAKALFKKACDGGMGYSCGQYKRLSKRGI